MAKRSDFKRNPRDYYRTWDYRGVAPLLPHLPPHTRFIECCAGNGVLVGHLSRAGHIPVDAYDIEPQCAWIGRRDATLWVPRQTHFQFITNPPWDRGLLHKLIVHLSDIAPTWLLVDSDWKATKQARPFMRRMRKIVTIGRIQWIEGSAMSAKDNCEFILFDKPDPYARPIFFGPIK